MHMKNYLSTDGPNVTRGQIARNLETEHLWIVEFLVYSRQQKQKIQNYHLTDESKGYKE